MRCIPQAAIGVLAGIVIVCASAQPASAQIISMLDENGKRVFINAEPPPAKGARATGTSSAVRGASGAARGTSAPATSREDLDRLVQAAAERHHVDPVLIRAVIDAESNWNPQAVSSKGAQGLMQLHPGTAGDLGVNDPFDPEQNVDGGVRYLRMLLEKYNGDLDKALAAYNAGPNAVQRAGGVPNYRETRTYVQKVTDAYFRPGNGRSGTLFSQTRSIYRTTDEKGRLVFRNE